jgi:hypothetical protein
MSLVFILVPVELRPPTSVVGGLGAARAVGGCGVHSVQRMAVIGA